LTVAAASSEPAAATGLDSALGRVVGVFVSPVRTFRSIAAKPTWLLPLLLWTACSFLVAELVTTRSDMRGVIARKMEQRGQKLSEAQLDAVAERAKQFSWMGEVFWVLFPGVIAAATAGVMWAACHAFGMELRFRQSFGVTVHAFLPHVLGAIALFGVLWGKTAIDPEAIEDLLPTHLGVLVSRTAAPAAHSLLSSIDLLSFWTMALLVLGLSFATKAPRGRIAALVLSVWALYVLGKAGVVAAFA
jgi:hypothetical protein